MDNKLNTYPVITKKSQKDFKNDPFYQDNVKDLERYKEVAKDDMELKYLISYVDAMINLCFFSKHNLCLFCYTEEEMLRDAFLYLENYVNSRYT